MNKALETLAAAGISYLVYMGFGVVRDYDKNFDYVGADEAHQQKYLEGAAKRFAKGAEEGGGGTFDVTDIFADASVDLISVSVKTKDVNTEYAPTDQIERERRSLSADFCKDVADTIGLDKGYTLRMRIFKPSGALLMAIQADAKTCAKYLTQKAT